MVWRGSIGGREYDGDGGGGVFVGQLIILLSEQMYMGMKKKMDEEKAAHTPGARRQEFIYI